MNFSLPFFVIFFVLDPVVFNYLAFEIRADNTAIDEYYSSYHEYAEMELNDEVKIVFIGASQTKHGINCQHLESQLSDVSCYNVGAPGDVPYYRISELPIIIQSNPDVVFLEVSPRSLTEISNLHNLENNLYIRYGLAGIHQDENQMSWSNSIRDEDKKYIVNNFMDEHHFRTNYRQEILDVRIENLFESIVKKNIKENNILYQESIDIKESKLNEFIFEASWQSSNDSINLDCMKFIINELESNGINVVLYSLPYEPLFIKNLPDGHWDSFNNTVKELVTEKELIYLNYGFEIWTSEEFRDLTHLYGSGIMRLSELLVKDVELIIE